MKLLKRSGFVLGFGVLVASVFIRVTWIYSFTGPVSTDGYYYLLQFQKAISGSELYFAKGQAFFSLLSAITKPFGIGDLALFNAVIILSIALFSISLSLLVEREQRWLAPAAAAVPWVSDIIFYRHYNFLAQGFSWALFMAAFAMIQVKGESKNRMNWLWIAFLIFAISIHNFTLFCGVFVLIFAAPLNPRLRVVATAFAAVTLPLLANLLNIRLFEAVPYSGFTWQYSCSIFSCSAFEQTEFTIYTFAAALILASMLWQHRFPRVGTAFLLLGFLFMAPIWERLNELAPRLALSAPWLLIPGFILSGYRFYLGLTIWLVLALYPVLDHSTPSEPQIYSVIRQNVDLIRKAVPGDSYIRAPHGAQFAITYYTGIPSGRGPTDCTDQRLCLTLRPRQFGEPPCRQGANSGSSVHLIPETSVQVIPEISVQFLINQNSIINQIIS